jgi:outer membrane immunogenic protein
VKIKIVILALVTSISAAAAADIPQPGPAAPPAYRPPPISPAYNWTGFYIGAMGGGGWSTSQGVDFKGGFAGGTIGANAQFSSFVIGAEAEGAWSNIGQTSGFLFGLPVTVTDTIQAFGSVTGRAGFAIDNLLIYGKGGFAFASNNLKFTGPGGSVGDTETHMGYTAGGGIEYGFTPNWSAKLEYLWAHYGSQNYFATLLPPGAPSGAFDVSTVKFGINYRFGWGGPVVARY